MEKHFLATISNEAENLFGVRFICSFLHKMSDTRVTLLHICKVDGNKKVLNSMWDASPQGNEETLPPEARKSVQKARKLLSDHKVPIYNLDIKTVSEKYGKVKDILAESGRGHYDAIVLGRRVSYTFQWIFERPADETFQAMIKEHSCVSPLWICPDVDPGRKNVLLCIDGSENSYRAADHVGFIVSSLPQHTITLLHIENSVGTECVEFFRRAEEILHSHKIATKRIQRKVIWDLSVSATILRETKHGNYAVVALGMGGRKQGKGNSRLAGPTTVKLIGKLEKASLWCCP